MEDKIIISWGTLTCSPRMEISSGVPSTRDHFPIEEFHPTIELRIQAWSSTVQLSKMMELVIRAPALMTQEAPMVTLGPSLDEGSSIAEGWITTSPTILAECADNEGRGDDDDDDDD